ncbi:isocitrate lyase/phosphoenolpyruvate mutase family protein [Parasphingorhabdus sp.]|uniref:isocitrate lyase/PEP mutase family protein n=1 Tax=Parasphingorhabdus sp. TaxID=2709688 RepID=UPI0032673BD9
MSDMVARFAKLHQPGRPLILYNIWDAGSAKIVAGAGARAVATGSLSVAGAQGYEDGEALPFDVAVTNAKHITSVVDIPVSIDLETGYGEQSDDVEANARSMKDIGVAGLNIEDQDLNSGGLRDIDEQATRLAAAASTGIFVNARTDLFIQTPLPEHDQALVRLALERGKAFADAGARSLFVPFVRDEQLIATLCEKSELPVNIMMMPDSPEILRLAELGVARISYGPGPWRAAMASFEEQAKRIFQIEL